MFYFIEVYATALLLCRALRIGGTFSVGTELLHLPKQSNLGQVQNYSMQIIWKVPYDKLFAKGKSVIKNTAVKSRFIFSET